MKPQRSQILLPILALAVFAVVAGLFIANKKEAEKKPKKSTTPYVATQEVQLTPTTLQVKSQAVMQPKFETTLTAQVSGEVQFIAPDFAPGGFVKRGTILAKIDPFNYQVALEQAKANLASARAAFILERAQGQVAEAEWEAISSAKPSELGLRKPQQEQALAAVKAAKASLKRAKKDLERTHILAPFDALIKTRSISLGAFINTGGAIGLVADTAIGELRLPVKQSDFEFLSGDGAGSKVVLFTSQREHTGARPNEKQWQGQIVRNEGVVDSNTRMTHLVAEIKDPYNLHATHANILPFGTYITARIDGRIVENTFSIQRHWLHNDQLPVLVDNILHYKSVTVLRHLDTQSIINSGLESGDQIITSPMNNPFEGMKVLPQSAKGTKASVALKPLQEASNNE